VAQQRGEEEEEEEDGDGSSGESTPSHTLENGLWISG
jgi:hypothetical protein